MSDNADEDEPNTDNADEDEYDAEDEPNTDNADNAEEEPRRPVVPRTPGESHSDDSGLEEATTTARQFIQDCERYNQMRRLGSSMK